MVKESSFVELFGKIDDDSSTMLEDLFFRLKSAEGSAFLQVHTHKRNIMDNDFDVNLITKPI